MSGTVAQWLALASVLGALGLASAVDGYGDLRHDRERALVQLSGRAALLETQVEHQLDTLHFALGNLQVAVAAAGKGLDQADTGQRLEGIRTSLRGVRTLAILDADGVVRASTRQELVGGNFAHREYFREVAARPDPARLVVSPPFRTVLGVLTINVSRALPARDGSFAGVVTATLDPEYFLRRLEAARYADDMQVALTAGDRTVFLAVPETASAWWQDAAERDGIFGTPPEEREIEDAALPIVAARGEKRVVAVRWVRAASMAPGSGRIGVLASRNLAVIDADGYRHVAVKLGLYAAVVLVGVFGLFLLQRRQRAYRETQARHEQALRDANAGLAARTRECEEAGAAKTRFLSSVGHELRTPLHTILGYVRLLLKQTSGEIHGQLAIVERSGTQLMQLVDDLLEFNRQADLGAELQPEPATLREILAPLENVGDLMARERGNRFSVTLGDDLPTAVSVDDRRLLQVLQNLVGNACKYTRGGTVDLRVERDADGAPADGRCRLRFTVDDTGIGIAPQEQARIFDVFSRGTATGGQPGLGLGLAIARRWVRAMGGDIEVQSEPGRGSRFFFTLDLPTATVVEQAPPAPCEAFREGLAAAARTVLVVDDIAANRLLLRDLCEQWGFQVTEAGDGAEALVTCLAPTAAIDAILVDQFMPGMDGWELLRRVRETPALRCLTAVLISASAAQKPAGFPPGVDFDLELGKPLDQQVLLCFLCRSLGLLEQSSATCPRPNATVAALAAASLPADELAKFRQLLHLGRVVAIAQWAQDLAAVDPAYGDFADRVARYCQAADLPALESLAQAVTSPSAGRAGE